MARFWKRTKKLRKLRARLLYKKDLNELKRQAKESNITFPFGNDYPCYMDRFEEGGEAKGHYFHQDLLVARRIYENSPSKHVDIGSRVDGFVAHVAAYREIEVFDIREIDSQVKNIQFSKFDLMNPPPQSLYNYCDSLSCLHALEHFGLGRYGDPINFEGYLDGLNNLQKILKKKGTLYLSVPIGSQRIEFNAHRVFSIAYLLELFEKQLEVRHFSYVDDLGNLHEDIKLDAELIKNNYSCSYGCGIFELEKVG